MVAKDPSPPTSKSRRPSRGPTKELSVRSELSRPERVLCRRGFLTWFVNTQNDSHLFFHCRYIPRSPSRRARVPRRGPVLLHMVYLLLTLQHLPLLLAYVCFGGPSTSLLVSYGTRGRVTTGGRTGPTYEASGRSVGVDKSALVKGGNDSPTLTPGGPTYPITPVLVVRPLCLSLSLSLCVSLSTPLPLVSDKVKRGKPVVHPCGPLSILGPPPLCHPGGTSYGCPRDPLLSSTPVTSVVFCETSPAFNAGEVLSVGES